ncbi:hybrid sensor histidine kinase/response regulator [Legionella yabuuchiae]|uniref:hybrid sensor histidine kinase/response regulator n=1 Tax=Legionella yabuuchiae TaxID=376727 RepID=UPI00105568B2|nr:hybrid sensor histidine kinase/response regulator [Legionella yabuuchiae]
MSKSVQKRDFACEETSATFSESKSVWYVSAMEHLVQVVQDLSQARDMKTIIHIVRHAARELTGADGATFILKDGNTCYYVEENAISPLWKGTRFPLNACISGWVMLHGETAIIKDIYQDPRIPQEAYRPTFVKSLVMVPIRRDKPIAAIGNYWAKIRTPSSEEVAILQALADITSVAMENVKLYEDLKAQIAKVKDREARIRSQHDTLEIFTRALAHDLKEPVRTIHAFSDIILQEQVLFGNIADYFRYIYTASEQMADLIERVLYYLQLERKKHITKKACDMNQLLQNAIKSLEPQIKEHLAEITYKPLPQVDGSPELITRLLKNLLRNAIYHNLNQPKIHISAEKTKNVWIFSVKDNGIGIDEKNMDKVFLPFKRVNTNYQGRGLGLAISARIIELHSGKLWCESEPGKGSTFYFSLPAQGRLKKSANKETSVIKNIIPDHSLPLANILIVDDLASDIELIQIMLNRARMQCNLFQANSAKEALSLIRRKHRENDWVDLVLLDINMPDMDGFEALQLIRSNKTLKKTAIVMCTGSTYQEDIEKAAELGASGYLIKPLERKSLEETIERLPHLQLCETPEGVLIQRKDEQTDFKPS